MSNSIITLNWGEGKEVEQKQTRIKEEDTGEKSEDEEEMVKKPKISEISQPWEDSGMQESVMLRKWRKQFQLDNDWMCNIFKPK